MPERDGRVATYETCILLHCRFYQAYEPILDALLLAPFDYGYVPPAPWR